MTSHQAETIGFVGVEFVAGEQPAHGVAPAGDLVHAQCRATEREDSALHFELGEARVAGAEVDVGRQHQFDADGVAVALHGHHQRLAWTPAAEGAPGIDGAFGEFPALAEGLADIGQVQPGGEMLAVGEEQGTAQLVVGLYSPSAATRSSSIGRSKALRLATRSRPSSSRWPRRSRLMRPGRVSFMRRFPGGGGQRRYRRLESGCPLSVSPMTHVGKTHTNVKIPV